MKYTIIESIIECDLCNSRIYRDGWFAQDGAIKFRAKELKRVSERIADIPVTYSDWKRGTYHICPKCVDKIKEICKGGKPDENP